MQNMKIRDARPEDLKYIVRIHQIAFRGFLMTLLGPKFLYAYYQLILEYPSRIFCVVADDHGKTRGFVAGFLEPNKFYERLSRRKWKLALAALVHLVLHLTLLPRVWHSFLRANNLARNSQYAEGAAELASIALDPSLTGRGLGKQLVLAFLNRAREMGAQRVHLTTDALGNDAVNAFYQRLGFKLSRNFTVVGNRLMNEYVYYWDEMGESRI
ncbi:GNAT family N-acetyltransferase [Moorellaceae bacterium AZ2]